MRILHLLSQTQLTGAEVYALTLSEWAIDHGHEVFIVSDKIHRPTKATYIARPIHSSKWLDRIVNIFYLRRFIIQNKIQVIHTHSRAAVRIAYWARLGTPVTIVSTIHGRQHYSLSKRIFDMYGDRVIGVCPNVTQGLLQEYKMSPRKIITLGNPVHYENKETSLLNSKSNRSAQSKRKIKLAWVGRFTGPKGIQLGHFISMEFDKILTKFQDLEITLIGGELLQLPQSVQRTLSNQMSHYPGRIQLLKVDDAEEILTEFDLVIGAGRVAISCLLKKVPCYAAGEIECLGLLRIENFQRARASNFGDMGVEFKTPSLSLPNDSFLNRFMRPADLDLAGALEFVTGFPLKSELEKLSLEALKYFSKSIVCTEVFEIYKSAYFQRLHPRPIPILMYHKIQLKESNASPHKIYVTVENFRNHLTWMKEWNLTPLTFRDLQDFRELHRDSSEFPTNPIVLTFDDGYQNNLTLAAPLLKEFNFRGVIYLLADHSLQTNLWDLNSDPNGQEPLLNLKEKKDLIEMGVFEIGSHGFKHEDMTKMSEEQARFELVESKHQLENELGIKVLSFAYPFGHTNSQLANLASEAGYSYSVNTDTGGLHPEENRQALFRVNIFPNETKSSLRKKTSWWYRYYFYFKRGR